ncbi:carboxypeptidase-like regulatory domain-containing protein, partial [Allorhizocola rhizosphaerae]|uniref:carboxypeptidase-like regulatory domain-containing protein n=1 Tax=Allorhizocola rhizosphaerae TaxID=1872709 RepID=UPI0013C357F0
MATQRRPWIARVSVVAAVSLGALVGVTSPAWAALSLQGANLTPNTINVGQESTFKFRIKDSNPATPQVEGVTIQVSSGAASCASNCSPGTVDLTAGVSDEITAKIKGNAAGQVTVRVVHSGGQIGTVPLTVNQGQQEQQTVGLLRGEVENNVDGKPISGAVVTVQDPTGKNFDVKTGSTGVYQFDGKALKIAPGDLIFTVTKDPFVLTGGPKTVRVGANENKTINLGMENPTAATTAPPTNTAPPTGEPSSTTTAAGAVDTKPAADSGGLDTMTWIMIIVGGLLVALGIGAIVLLLVRRNNDEDEDEEDDEDDEPVRGRPGGPRGPAGAAPRPAGGVYGGAAAGATAVYG